MTLLTACRLTLASPAPLVDRYGTCHQTASVGACLAFAQAVEAIVAHRSDAAAALDRALAADPHLVAVYALRGLAQVVLARPETIAAARAALARAEAALAERGAGCTGDERALLDALALGSEGRLLAAVDRLDLTLAQNPQALLLLKLSHTLRFLAGDVPGMLRTTHAALRACTPAMRGYGFLLGCHAFALGETGDLAGAESFGRRAVELEPRDAWALHAVAHVHETRGQAEAGIAWIEGARPAWVGCNNFAFHLAWHLALFHLERGRHEAVLDLYDREVRPGPGEDFRDYANAASLLERLRQEGIDVGDRWRELAEVAARRRHETTLVFAALHRLLALTVAGDLTAARETVAALEAEAAAGRGDQSRVAALVGIPLARAILASAEGGAGDPMEVGAVLDGLDRLGGSRAQRDVFLRFLAERAATAGDGAGLNVVLAWRRRLRRDDRFAAVIRTRGGR
jgi:tetratricopeptide (TPR) repeat protein